MSSFAAFHDLIMTDLNTVRSTMPVSSQMLPWMHWKLKRIEFMCELRDIIYVNMHRNTKQLNLFLQRTSSQLVNRNSL